MKVRSPRSDQVWTRKGKSEIEIRLQGTFPRSKEMRSFISCARPIEIHKTHNTVDWCKYAKDRRKKCSAGKKGNSKKKEKEHANNVQLTHKLKKIKNALGHAKISKK